MLLNFAILWNRHRLLEVLSSRNVEVGDFLRNRRDFTHSAGISTTTNNYAAKGIALYQCYNFATCWGCNWTHWGLLLFFVFLLWTCLAGYASDRIFAPYTVYKGKAAFSLSPCLPTFTKLDVRLLFSFNNFIEWTFYVCVFVCVLLTHLFIIMNSTCAVRDCCSWSTWFNDDDFHAFYWRAQIWLGEETGNCVCYSICMVKGYWGFDVFFVYLSHSDYLFVEICSLSHWSWFFDNYGLSRFLWIFSWPFNVIKVGFMALGLGFDGQLNIVWVNYNGVESKVHHH